MVTEALLEMFLDFLSILTYKIISRSSALYLWDTLFIVTIFVLFRHRFKEYVSLWTIIINETVQNIFNRQPFSFFLHGRSLLITCNL